MATYILGDVHGCFEKLQGLLDLIHFDEKRDVLWFVGDLVNRGPDSLKTLRFVKSLPQTVIVLGNHDLHLIAAHYGFKTLDSDDTLQEILDASDREELIDWMRHQKLLHYDALFDVVMVHAGLAPEWNCNEAMMLAQEVERALQSEQVDVFLKNMYGDEPNVWSDDLQGYTRLRVITNYLTRIRFCNAQGNLSGKKAASSADCSDGLFPWFKVPARKMENQVIVFGHWSALLGKTGMPNVFALDTGVIWGGALTALRLDDMRRFSYK